jgi:release factor glutamine methyltransferase
MTTLVTDFVKQLSQRLLPASTNINVASQEAWWLLEKLTDSRKSELLLQNNLELNDAQITNLNEWVTQRVVFKKPLQYILGTVPFGDLEILVEPPVLIPRPETEEWVNWLINKLEPLKNEFFDVLDLCTGTGCIALSIAKSFEHAKIIGVDINATATKLAQKNQNANSAKNVSWIISDLFKALPPSQKFDLIICNPPYASEHEWTKLDEDVRWWEDKKAIVAGKTGNELYEKVIIESVAWLKPKSKLTTYALPRLVLELGIGNDAVEAIVRQHGFTNVSVHRDLQGVKRWLEARI